MKSYPAPTPLTVTVDGVPMSGLMTAVEHPRAVVVALHGGATTPAYFDSPGFPHQSLLRVAARLGFTVLAPDRPGYGASREALGDSVSPALQVDLTYGLIDQALAGCHRGAGLFLLGHSQGAVLTAKMAVDSRATNLLGIELAGTGVHHSVEARNRMASAATPGAPGMKLQNLLWQPAHLYRDRKQVLSWAPKFEGIDAQLWPQDLAELAPRITVPTRISLGDHESWWLSGTAGLDSIAELFTSSPRVVADEQINSGHNISLGISALAYHLKVLSFVEECVLMHERIDMDHNEMETSNG